MPYRITVLPGKQNMDASGDEKLLEALRKAGFAVDAPCGGMGKCGKCRVLVDGKEALACRTVVDRDMTVEIPAAAGQNILTDSIAQQDAPTPSANGYLLAFDIGTTTVVGYLLDGNTGRELAAESRRNPQAAYGADVISRIQHALKGQLDVLTGSIRGCAEEITLALCERAKIKPAEIRIVSLVGNPAMQQLFLGISPENLARIPFAPVLTQVQTVPAKEYLPLWENAALLIVPDISGFVGADTVACVLATGLDTKDEATLLVDIGTNGEMVLGNQRRMVACSAAAGPALEGANIQFGMRGQAGAIDHVWIENGRFRCSVIGGGEAVGICGSGLIDAVAAALDAGLINTRGRIQIEERILHLTDTVFLTQEDIRQVQLAKGAIAAGIERMAAHLGISLTDIDKVYLAGAFGTFMNAASACRIGLLPAELRGKITAIGNGAGSGAKKLARSPQALAKAQQLASRIEFLELAAAPGFQRTFAQNMRF